MTCHIRLICFMRQKPVAIMISYLQLNIKIVLEVSAKLELAMFCLNGLSCDLPTPFWTTGVMYCMHVCMYDTLHHTCVPFVHRQIHRIILN